MTKTKTTPYRILAQLLYGRHEWIENLGQGRIRLHTSKAARSVRVASADLWTYLYWLRDCQLLQEVEKESKRGTALITLRLPLSFTQLGVDI